MTKNTKTKRTKLNTSSGVATTTRKKDQRPVVLVLEGLSGAMYAVQRAGGKPKVVNPRNVAEIERALTEPFDALLLTGGGDVDPRLYGERPSKKVYGVSEVRDLTEWCALDYAKEHGVPVLGICRGAQIMAVHNGGKLTQHLPGHSGTDHPVTTERGTHFAKTVGKGMMTISLHHQVVRRHGAGFRVAARAGEGTIEAIESVDGRCLGVQFHPEMNWSRNSDSRAIFAWLTAEAAKRAKLPAPAEWEDAPTRAYSKGAARDAGFLAPAKKKAKPKNRKAGQQRLPGMGGQHPAFRRSGPVQTTWQCPSCAVRFDEKADRDDHVTFIHGGAPSATSLERDVSRWASDLLDNVSGDGAWPDPEPWELGLEPPPGHSDWT